LEIPNEVTMLIRFKCTDMGLNCHFEVKGETLEEVSQKALDHVRENHASEFNVIDTQVQIDKMREALARSTRVVLA
jgi:predicted small metal-binding protein